MDVSEQGIMVGDKKQCSYASPVTQNMVIFRGLLLLTICFAVFTSPVESSDGSDVTNLSGNLDSNVAEIERQRRSSSLEAEGEAWFDEPTEEEKMARYVLGKRNNRFFLGKRYNTFLGKRFDSGEDFENDDEKRAKYFLGKRNDDDSGEAWDKRAKYFLGKRFNDEDGFADDANEYEKRAKYFLGKRPKYFLGKRSSSLADEDYSSLLKRAKYFLGKRAKYFLGKRSPADDEQIASERLDSMEDKRAKYFLGKRGSDETGSIEKRPKYFLG